MLNRVIMVTMLLAMVPAWGWIVVAVVAVIVFVMILVVTVTGSTTGALASDFHYQCDSAIGPESSVVMTEPPVAGGDESRYPTATPSVVPSTNPYASLTVAPDDKSVNDWQRSCLTAMRAAPYQLPPLRGYNSGTAAECARQLALAGAQGGGAAQSGGDAAFARSVIAQASAAPFTGNCGSGGANGQEAAGGQGAPQIRYGSDGSVQAESCADISKPGLPTMVSLPATVAEQAACGQRVATAAASAGDLVFWDFRNNAPTRVGVSVGGTQLVTIDPSTGQAVEQYIPTGADVRVKRVLRGAA
ncbi:hypothetical protein [Nocardia blacklockiae]|uniref:hypothetical protein n=1 Tax=Nocardia blacklockiae TaxID=480036 RepID=UPI001894A4BA|nr:hypothetical protein [Nocardia blacklockiae]MBF6175663.1 hypothetical protein [Nocardia blacklockiae]